VKAVRQAVNGPDSCVLTHLSTMVSLTGKEQGLCALAYRPGRGVASDPDPGRPRKRIAK